MLEWLHKIFIGHTHVWIEQDRIRLTGRNTTSIVGIVILSRCAQCGKLHKDRIDHNSK